MLIGQLPRLANAVATMGTTAQPLPFGPTAALQFATCYVNVAVPSGTRRTRSYNASGPTRRRPLRWHDRLRLRLRRPALLFVLVFFISDIDLGLSLSTDQLSGVATTALIVLAALIAAGVISLAVASWRQRVADWLHEGRDALQVLHDSHKLIFGGTLLS